MALISFHWGEKIHQALHAYLHDKKHERFDNHDRLKKVRKNLPQSLQAEIFENLRR